MLIPVYEIEEYRDTYGHEPEVCEVYRPVEVELWDKEEERKCKVATFKYTRDQIEAYERGQLPYGLKTVAV